MNSQETYQLHRALLVELDNSDTGGQDYIHQLMMISGSFTQSGEYNSDELNDWTCNIAGYIADYMKPEGESPIGNLGNMNELLARLDKAFSSK